MFKRSKSKYIDFSKLYEIAEEIYEENPLVKRKKKKRPLFLFFKYFFLVFLLLFLILLIVFAFNFIRFKKIYQNILVGKNNLEYSVEEFKQKDYEKSKLFANIAQNNFQNALNSLNFYQKNQQIKKITYLKNQFDDLNNLILASNILSKSIVQGSDFAENLNKVLGVDNLAFPQKSQKEKEKIIKAIYSGGSNLGKIQKNVSLAILSLNKIHYNGLLFLLKGKINKIKDNLIYANTLLKQTIPLSHFLPVLAGSPQKSSFLVFLQNKDELRPTGGFLGTYGILETKNGEILRFDTHDIYHMDMPVKDKLNIKPPKPLEKYLGVKKWFLRDANWSPDWLTSAKTLLNFYKKEDALLPSKDKINNFEGDFDGVIGITPDFITDLIKITGPIQVDDEIYTEKNFTKLLEYKVEKGYVLDGVSSWHRKEEVGKIAKVLQTKLFNLKNEKYLELLNAVGRNLDQKNIIFYFQDKNQEDFVIKQNWSGNMQASEGDFLMVVDANMASYKTDSVINRKINYTVDESINGIFADLKISYAHRGGFDWRTTRYRTYTRVYVPEGAELLRVSGQSDDEVLAYKELGKTVFAVFLSVEPGEIGTLEFKYKLPNSVKNDQNYKLYVQKQPGKQSELTIDFKALNMIKSYNPNGFYVEKNGNEVKWNTDLDVDKKFEIDF